MLWTQRWYGTTQAKIKKRFENKQVKNRNKMYEWGEKKAQKYFVLTRNKYD